MARAGKIFAMIPPAPIVHECCIPYPTALIQPALHQSGSPDWFVYQEGEVRASTSFQAFLQLLARAGVINTDAPIPTRLQEISTLLNDPIRGLQREPGKERWEITEKSAMANARDALLGALSSLGMLEGERPSQKITVDHCLILGARVERMHLRLNETMELHDKNLLAFNSLFLLGSNRKLIAEETRYLEESGCLRFCDGETVHTESDALNCLWEACLASRLDRQLLKKKMSLITATATGTSYNGQAGWRPTVQSTLDLWHERFQKDAAESVFALAEKPYARLIDQLVWTIWTDNRTADAYKLRENIARFRIFACFPAATTTNLAVLLDEVARQVYHLKQRIDFITPEAQGVYPR